jgi:flagellar motor switch/type III secretory pathway protein FliN
MEDNELDTTESLSEDLTESLDEGLDEGLNENMVEYIRENMELTLTCEIGGLQVSLNELINYKPGMLLDVLTDLQMVKLKVNSTTIGYGQVVEVGGKYGIKVTKMLSLIDSLSS